VEYTLLEHLAMMQDLNDYCTSVSPCCTASVSQCRSTSHNQSVTSALGQPNVDAPSTSGLQVRQLYLCLVQLLLTVTCVISILGQSAIASTTGPAFKQQIRHQRLRRKMKTSNQMIERYVTVAVGFCVLLCVRHMTFDVLIKCFALRLFGILFETLNDSNLTKMEKTRNCVRCRKKDFAYSSPKQNAQSPQPITVLPQHPSQPVVQEPAKAPVAPSDIREEFVTPPTSPPKVPSVSDKPSDRSAPGGNGAGHVPAQKPRPKPAPSTTPDPNFQTPTQYPNTGTQPVEPSPISANRQTPAATTPGQSTTWTRGTRLPDKPPITTRYESEPFTRKK
jgi:hypothetical protein